MGFLKVILKLFSCKSSCMFNEQVFDMAHMDLSLKNYELKYKDIETIHKILNKRKQKLTPSPTASITSI